MRVHFGEKAALDASLRACDEKIRTVEQKLTALANDPRRAEFERAYYRLLGARDQVAETVRRLPLETGELFDLDKERYEQAVRSFDRVYQLWDHSTSQSERR
jgi:hypothetical protein